MNARIELPLGVFDNIDIEVYHASPALSHSGLRDFAQSPFHYHARHINPLRPPREPTQSQLDGHLAHCAILEPAEFYKRYAIGPVDDRRLKAWKTWEEGIDRSLTAIKPTEARVAQAQAFSVRAIPDVAKLLASGRPEVSAWWIDEATGVHCRCRPDWVHDVGGNRVILVDVKTFSTASPSDFARQVARMSYHTQAAWYSEGYAKASGAEVIGFVFVAVEMAWPYAACGVMLDDESLAAGFTENLGLLQSFAECQRKDDWPGYSSTIELITLPRWAA